MEPIINPLWFYLIDTVTSLKVFIMVTGIGIVIILAIISLCHAGLSQSNLENFWKHKATKISAIISPILIIIGCLIPCPETAYKMLIASLVTPDNIDAAGGAVQDIIDYIINSVDTLLESND